MTILLLLIALAIIGGSALLAKFGLKGRMSRALGRDVDEMELSSINNWMEVQQAEASPNQANIERQKRNRWIPVGIVAGVLMLLVAGFGIFLFLNMPETTYNRLNPFTPKPPENSFPASIAGYSLREEPTIFSGFGDEDYRYDSKYYNGSKSVNYVVEMYKSAEDAKKGLENYIRLHKETPHGSFKSRIANETDSRFIVKYLDTEDNKSDRNTLDIKQLAGKYLINIDAEAPAAVEFYNNLPFQAFGIAPPQLLAEEYAKSEKYVEPPPVPFSQVVEEFNKNPESAGKYAEKRILMSGEIVQKGKNKAGLPFLLFKIPGSETSVETVLNGVAVFPKRSLDTNTLKKGDVVSFKCEKLESLDVELETTDKAAGFSDCRIVEVKK